MDNPTWLDVFKALQLEVDAATAAVDAAADAEAAAANRVAEAKIELDAAEDRLGALHKALSAVRIAAPLAARTAIDTYLLTGDAAKAAAVLAEETAGRVAMSEGFV